MRTVAIVVFASIIGWGVALAWLECRATNNGGSEMGHRFEYIDNRGKLLVVIFDSSLKIPDGDQRIRVGLYQPLTDNVNYEQDATFTRIR